MAIMGGEMKQEDVPSISPDQADSYEIRIKGTIGDQWFDMFEGLNITQDEEGNSILAGPIIDQAALHGLLKTIRDLGLQLLSVNRFTSEQQKPNDSKD
jgi:hypothetical protein